MTYLLCFLSTAVAVRGGDWLNATFTPGHPGRAQVILIAAGSIVGAALDWRAIRARRRLKAAQRAERAEAEAAH